MLYFRYLKGLRLLCGLFCVCALGLGSLILVPLAGAAETNSTAAPKIVVPVQTPTSVKASTTSVNKTVTTKPNPTLQKTIGAPRIEAGPATSVSSKVNPDLMPRGVNYNGRWLPSSGHVLRFPDGTQSHIARSPDYLVTPLGVLKDGSRTGPKRPSRGETPANSNMNEVPVSRTR